MKSGYRIFWTDNALLELDQTLEYLENEWTATEIRKFSRELDHIIDLISKNPELFQKAKNGVRRAVILKLNSLYYRRNGDVIEILSLYPNRKNPDELNIG